MKSTTANSKFSGMPILLVTAIALASVSGLIAQTMAAKAARPRAASTVEVRGFETPQQAADALVKAASDFNEPALAEMFGVDGMDVILTGDYAQDRQRATDFTTEAREQTKVSVDPKSGARAFVLVGKEAWPFPVPVVKTGGKWFFDAKAGRRELVARRIGGDELDAIAICRNYVEAQHEYAEKPREGYEVNQYAQRIISTAGSQDGLAWQNADGAWEGPIGDKVAKAIEQGLDAGEPFHGYFFKILKGQGPAAPLGELDFVVKGAMIGGFALVAAPAEYGVTGVQTFMVSHDGVVYQKDLGPKTMEVFRSMERFNPDASWTPVPEEDQ